MTWLLASEGLRKRRMGDLPRLQEDLGCSWVWGSGEIHIILGKRHSMLSDNRAQASAPPFCQVDQGDLRFEKSLRKQYWGGQMRFDQSVQIIFT